MASCPIASRSGDFHRAFCVYSLAASLRHVGMTDDETEAAEHIVAPAFARVMATRASSPLEAASKVDAILAEYGEGLIDPEMLRAVAADLRGMVQ